MNSFEMPPNVGKAINIKKLYTRVNEYLPFSRSWQATASLKLFPPHFNRQIWSAKNSIIFALLLKDEFHN